MHFESKYMGGTVYICKAWIASDTLVLSLKHATPGSELDIILIHNVQTVT